MAKLSRIAPEIPVSNLQDSVDYYQHALGFQLTMETPARDYAIVERDGKAGFRMVPNDNNTYFIPIFTHADALAPAVAELREGVAEGEFQTTRAGGERAFPIIAKELADGIVINYLGPSEPAAFKISVTELMLAELAKGAT